MRRLRNTRKLCACKTKAAPLLLPVVVALELVNDLEVGLRGMRLAVDFYHKQSKGHTDAPKKPARSVETCACVNLACGSSIGIGVPAASPMSWTLH